MSSLRRAAAALAAVSVAIGGVAPPAAAHFVLRSPAPWRDQDALGNPQKLGPCGDEGSAATTGVVTAFAPGETITITLDEVIFHPGHYRVALAVHDRSELPPEPPVTPGATDCGSVPVMDTPVFPVLADGMLPHSEPFPGTQALQVTLPPDVTCTHCTLQVLEFMSSHGAPCFYHHCADIAIGTSGGECETDADCADRNACTTDRCAPATRTCEHEGTPGATCDDGDPCTRDACSAAEGCVFPPLTLADARPGFLGTPDVASCADEPVPAAVGRLFGRAEGLLTRAAANPAKAARLLRRAAQRLRKAAKKVAKAHKRRISAGCGSALARVVEDAQGRLACLSGGA